MRIDRDGQLELREHFLRVDEADRSLDRLMADLPWQEETVTIAGRRLVVPRRVCWHGDNGARYRYSGVDHHPRPWTPELLRVKAMIEAATGREFNSVLGNLYRDGNDSMGWHADKERELGPEPFIASLSLGAERVFELRHNADREVTRVFLPHGSLLLMGGKLQRCWRHRVPKMPGIRLPRINLTFRTIVVPQEWSR